jgi:uncharacterized protein (TIGR03435 family)
MNEPVVRNCRKLLLLAAGWLAVAAPIAFGQGNASAPQAATTAVNAPAYDVVSIKPTKSGAINNGDGTISSRSRVMAPADGYSATNVSLKSLIQNAYGIKEDLISGVPSWAETAGYDVEAKMDESVAAALQQLPAEQRAEHRRLMLQSLLADRFKLKAHREAKELPIYALVIAKGGFKLKEADPNKTDTNGVKGPDGRPLPMGMMMMRPGQLNAKAIPISNLVANLSQQLHRTVVDKTGLTGKYDITLQWTPEEGSGPMFPGGPPSGAPPPPDPNGPSIFTALQEQLGLRLDSTKGPVETLVLDHVETPSEN